MEDVIKINHNYYNYNVYGEISTNLVALWSLCRQQLTLAPLIADSCMYNVQKIVTYLITGIGLEVQVGRR
jgi:hypothetical protein